MLSSLTFVGGTYQTKIKFVGKVSNLRMKVFGTRRRKIADVYQLRTVGWKINLWRTEILSDFYLPENFNQISRQMSFVRSHMAMDCNCGYTS